MTGQVLDSPVASLVLPVLMRPILSNLERQDMAASQTLRAALSKVMIKYGLYQLLIYVSGGTHPPRVHLRPRDEDDPQGGPQCQHE